MCSGLRTMPTGLVSGLGDQPVSSWRAICPCPPAMTMRMSSTVSTVGEAWTCARR